MKTEDLIAEFIKTHKPWLYDSERARKVFEPKEDKPIIKTAKRP